VLAVQPICVPILRRLKVMTLRGAEQLGVFSAVSRSRWRQQRLLILCYHGISLADEHQWSDAYIPESHLRRRFEILRDNHYSVLPLGEALERLSRDDLPPAAVAITFDDGLYDFYAKAQKLVYEFAFPVTAYVPTYYALFSRPVFDLACSYFLWKGRGRHIDFGTLLPEPTRATIPLDSAVRDALHLRIRSHVNSVRYSAADKDSMLGELSLKVGVDWQSFVRSRMLQLMSPEEIASLDRRYIDVQLHTHRHRTPRDSGLFMRELDDNIAALDSMGFSSGGLRHFCYPSGDADPLFYPWLEARGIRSATTCEPRMVSRQTHWLNLPRLVDTTGLTETEFQGWVSGVASFVPRRRRAAAADW
jgi:peptidoglycan/xylan/chitin deacetylase (PgdA/CDA1 family)